MSKLPLITVKQFEKLLFQLGLNLKGKKEVMYFKGIRMEDTQHFHITEIK